MEFISIHMCMRVCMEDIHRIACVQVLYFTLKKEGEDFACDSFFSMASLEFGLVNTSGLPWVVE